MQCKDIPELPILQFLKQHQGRWCMWGDGYSMPTVQDAMPKQTPHKLQLAKTPTIAGISSLCAVL